jgi:hypothetical protein
LTVLALLSTILAIPTILTASLANNLQQREIPLCMFLFHLHSQLSATNA